MQFFDWNGQRLYLTNGQFFRPPIIVSTGPVMVIKFIANGGSNLGFKALYSFSFDSSYITTALLPATGMQSVTSILKKACLHNFLQDCGGLADNLGGAITMIEIAEENTKFYDCVWIVQPQQTYANWKTHIYLSVASFSNFGTTITFDNLLIFDCCVLTVAENTILSIHEGITSLEEPVEVIKQTSENVTGRQHVVPLSKGFYISLKGGFRPQSKLVIVYSAFSYKGLYFL